MNEIWIYKQTLQYHHFHHFLEIKAPKYEYHHFELALNSSFKTSSIEVGSFSETLDSFVNVLAPIKTDS
jgi:hypothetical protein